MTVQTNNNSISYVGNGSTTHFDYDYLILNASHLKVYFGDVLQTSGYVVSGVSSQTGGTVAFAVAPPNGTNITLIRDVPFLQLTDYQPYDAFPAESHERALDLLTMMTQQLKDELGRTMQHPISVNKWDAKGNEIINVGTGSSGTSAANIDQVKYLIASEVGDDPSASASVRSREALRRSYAEAGYNLVDGSFEVGGVLVNANDVLLHEASGKAYSGPAGVVAAGTNPASGGFVDKSGGLLRHEIDQVHTRTFANVDAMLAFNGLEVGKRYSTGDTTWKMASKSDPVVIGDFEALNSINVKDFGAVSEGVVDETLLVKAAIDSAQPYSTVVVYNHVFSDAIIIDKPLTIVAGNGSSTVEQTTWGAPVWIVKGGVSDVKFMGKHRQVYNGARTYPMPVPTSSDARVQEHYDLFRGSERVLCAGITARGPVDDLYIEHVYAKGFFCGTAISGVNSNNLFDSKNVRIDHAHYVDTDWGVLVGGALRDLTIGTLIADNVTHISPNDPSHAIYVGPRAAGVFYQRVTIDTLIVNSCQPHVEGENTSDAFSIRSCIDAYIGKLFVRNSILVGNTRAGTRLVINEIFAELDSYTVDSVLLATIDAQTNSIITVNDGYILSRMGCIGDQDAPMFSAASTASINVVAGTYENIRGIPGSFMRFGGVNMSVGSEVKVKWSSDPVVVENGLGYLMYAYIDPSDFVLIDQPYIEGTSKIFRLTTPSITNNWLVRLAHGKIRSGINSGSIFNPSGQYRIEFDGFARDGALIPDGKTDPEMHGANTFQTRNTSPTNLSSFKRGVPGQQYIIVAGDSNTTIINGNFVNGFVTSDGNNIQAGSWSSVVCLWVGDRLYEQSRTPA